MPPKRKPLPDSVPSSVFASRLVMEDGITVERLRDPALVIISQGIRRRDPDDLHMMEYLSALQAVYERAFFSHETAAAVWGMWLPHHMIGVEPVHVSKTLRAGTRARRTGVKGHVLSPQARVTEYLGLKLTIPEWTWVDLACTDMGLEHLVAAGDSLLQRSDGPSGEREPGVHPRSSVDSIRRVIALRTKVKGITRARAVVEMLREGSDSAQESRLRTRIVGAGYTEPTVNPGVPMSDGGTITPDLVWEDVKICVQYEGEHHRTDPRQWDRDIQRDLRMQREGWIVIRVTKEVFTRVGWARFVVNLDRAFATQSAR